MLQSINENTENCWKTLTDSAEGNQQPSLEIGRFNDYLEREYTQVGGSTVLPIGKKI